MIRAILAAAVFVSAAAPVSAASLEAAGATFTKLLEKYVTPRGVRYKAWRSDGDDLKAISAVVASIRGVDVKTLTPEERKAVYVNLYNAKVIESVLQGNPKVSIRQLSKVFDRKVILLGSKGVSLNDLEKQLRTEFKDPRALFALNCAARSSPPIRPEVFRVATLEAQLEEHTRAYLALPGAIAMKTSGGRTTITASRLFDRFEADFEAGGGALAFIAKYGPPEVAAAAASGKARLEFAPWDWSLNSAP